MVKTGAFRDFDDGAIFHAGPSYDHRALLCGGGHGPIHSDGSVATTCECLAQGLVQVFLGGPD
jgi:hypothetical protein